jgi:eukaryotic-like serine/threonine-protein kinase
MRILLPSARTVLTSGIGVPMGTDELRGWGFEEGDEIAADLYAVRLLGGGLRYEAYLAWHDGLMALVATKVLRPDLVASDRARAALDREAKALSALSHPAIVRAFGYAPNHERPHLVLEFLDGPRLSTLVRKYGIVIEQLLPLALEVCAALHYMHGRGYLHLDVKPRNLIMAAPPRLIDLSVAVHLDDVGRLTSPVGTDAYMAPEQCDPGRFGELGPTTDVWGLGVTLYEALTRTLPFSAPGDEGATLYPQLRERPRPPGRDVPPDLARTILGCLEHDPAARPSPRELAETLEPWVAALPRPRLGLFRPGGRVRESVFDLG